MSLKMKPEHKKYIRLVTGLILLILGSLFMFIPFIPLGYIFLVASLFLLASYIPPLNRVIEKLRTKDEKDRLGKVEKKIVEGEKFIDEKLVDKEDVGGSI